MVRIKVYKASQLAVAAAALILGIVLIAILVSFWMNGKTRAAGLHVLSADSGAVVEAAAAFSVSDSMPVVPLFGEDVLPENEHTDAEADDIIIEVVRADNIEQAARPRVLIYHTHTCEAYEQVNDDPYVETETWRTADQAHSVVRVGEALAQLLTSQGFEVVHDMTDHENPQLSTAYTRSLKTLEGYREEEFDLYIDLHRDAWNSSMEDSVLIDGQMAAQLMVLIGNGGNYEVKPDYEANLQFARLLTDRLNRLSPGVCREVMVKNGRYNQHMNTPSILIEVGHNKNTLQQALSSMPVLADALKDIMMSDG